MYNVEQSKKKLTQASKNKAPTTNFLNNCGEPILSMQKNMCLHFLYFFSRMLKLACFVVGIVQVLSQATFPTDPTLAYTKGPTVKPASNYQY